MSLDLSRIRGDFPHLNITPNRRDRGATAYRIQLPVFPVGREFAWAELLLPRGFPEHATAKIVLTPDERILPLLLAVQEKFLEPCLNSELDGDFSNEPLNYWMIEVGRARSRRD